MLRHFNFFPALFHLGLFAKFHWNSWRVSLTLQFICVVYLLFVRQQSFIKLCISSTLNNGREFLIGPCSFTATILIPLVITALRDTQLCRATFTPLGEEVARQTSAPWAGVASCSPPKRVLLEYPYHPYSSHQGFCSLLLSSAFLPLAAPAIKGRLFAVLVTICGHCTYALLPSFSPFCH